MADYVIIANAVNTNWIIYIELKQGNNGKRSQIIKKLEGATCLIEYCRMVGTTFFEESDFLNHNDYKRRYVSVKNIGVNKKPRPTKKTSSLHDHPDNMLQISAPPNKGVRFENLIHYK